MAGFKCSDFSSECWKPITEDSEDHNSSSRYVDDDDDEGFVFFGNFFCNFVKYVDWRSIIHAKKRNEPNLATKVTRCRKVEFVLALCQLCLDSLECVYLYFRLKDFGP